MPALRRGSVSLTTASLIVFVMFTPLGEELEGNLVTHMVVQHLAFILAGFVYAYGFATMLLVASQFSARIASARAAFQRFNVLFNRAGVLTFAISALSIAYWYVPENFDAAVLSESLHLEMHLTLLFVGMLIFVGSSQLARRIRRIAPIIAGKALGMYGMFLALTTFNVYPVYPISQQVYAGVALLIIMLILDFTLVPAWLYDYFGKTSTESRITMAGLDAFD